MNKHFYPAIFHEEDNAYWVEFPGLPGCVTQGDTFEEAYEMSTEVLGLYLETKKRFQISRTVKKRQNQSRQEQLCCYDRI